MTLFDVAKKNIAGNFRSYLLYFMSLLFNVVIYYTFVSLQYSKEIAERVESSGSMQSVFMIASIFLLLFAAVFTLYSNRFFARKRMKEIGLYSLLGLRKKTIGKMLFYENLILGAIVLIAGILIGTLLSKLFNMILLKLLDASVDVGMTFSIEAIGNTAAVFAALILLTSFQSYRLIYNNTLYELFQGEQQGEWEPKAFVLPAVLSVFFLGVGYWFAFRDFDDNQDILLNLGVMTGGIIAGTALLFSSLVVLLLKWARRRKRSYYKGMNLIVISNLAYRIKGNAYTLCVISLLSAVALCAASIGAGTYYGFEKTARLTAPFSYMFISQDEAFDRTADEIIRSDKEHPVAMRVDIPVIRSKGFASSPEVLSERERNAAEYPIKIISISQYNTISEALHVPALPPIEEQEAIAVRPMYTDKTQADYEGETVTLQLPKGDLALNFAGMTVERVLNWSYPDIMIVVHDAAFQRIGTETAPVRYIGYAVQQQKSTKQTADELAAVKTDASELSSYYSVYRLGIEETALNVFVLGFLTLVFIMASGSIIYFKQLGEAAADKARYDILKKIGVGGKTIAGSIQKQNAFIFMLPLVIGLSHYIVILGLLKRLFSNMAGVNMALPIAICVLAFILVYAVYYAMTVRSTHRIVLGGDGDTASVPRTAVIVIAACVTAAAGISVWSWTAAPEQETVAGEAIRLDLPAPSGPYSVGRTELHLIDGNRTDPWVNEGPRELMASIWYPAKQPADGELAPYMPAGAAERYARNNLPTIGLDPDSVDFSAIRTHAWTDAPALPSGEGRPVLLYSPGGSVPRHFGTILVEELASRGYVVVTADHPYETSAVEFPDGRVITEQLPEGDRAKVILKMLDVRVQDMRFILDRLTSMKDRLHAADTEKELPAGLLDAMDLSHVGMFGHSAGGATAAQTMYEDDRVDAGIDMDGTMGYMPDFPLPVAQHGLDRPFLLMEAGYNSDGEVDSHLTAEDRSSFWKQSTGWKMDLSMPKGNHYTFTDYQALLPELETRLSISPQAIQNLIGSADPAQLLEAQRTYVPAFFDRHLKGIPQPILDDPAGRYPEVVVVK